MSISECSKAKYIGDGFISVFTYKCWAWDIWVQFGRESMVNDMKRQRKHNWDWVGQLMVLLTLAEYSICRDVDTSCVLLQLQGLNSDT
jgi:hypothetical protein